MLEAIGINVLSAGILAGTGFVATRLSAMLPNRALWRLSDPGNLTICVAESTAVDTGKYLRRGTGVGQLRALAEISPSLTRAYGAIDTRYIQLAGDPLGVRAEGDLICLGGVKTNHRTADLLDAFARQGYDVPSMDGSIILWPADGKDARYEADTVDNAVVMDYGFVIRAPNPLGATSTAIVLAGASTYGVVAAARYFVDACKYRRGWFAALVRSPVRDGHACPPELVRFQAIRGTARR